MRCHLTQFFTRPPEFDPVDILHQEGDGIALSRWIISLDGKKVTVNKWNALDKLRTGSAHDSRVRRPRHITNCTRAMIYSGLMARVVDAHVVDQA